MKNDFENVNFTYFYYSFQSSGKSCENILVVSCTSVWIPDLIFKSWMDSNRYVVDYVYSCLCIMYFPFAQCWCNYGALRIVCLLQMSTNVGHSTTPIDKIEEICRYGHLWHPICSLFEYFSLWLKRVCITIWQHRNFLMTCS